MEIKFSSGKPEKEKQEILKFIFCCNPEDC